LIEPGTPAASPEPAAPSEEGLGLGTGRRKVRNWRLGRKPSPRLAQAARTWYFLKRNTLAMVGLGVLLLLVALALYALTLPLSYASLSAYCASSQTTPNTFSSTSATITVGTVLQPGLTNGTYGFAVQTKAAYTPSPGAGSITVDGSAVTENVTFAAGGPGSPVPHFTSTAPYTTAPSYSVTFHESGLPGGTTWSVTLNSTSPSVCTPGFLVVCTYPAGSSSPGPGCYQTPAQDPSVIAPTFGLSPIASGPLPLGSLTLDPSHPYFYDTWQGILRGSDWSLMISVTIVGSGALAGLLIGAIAGEFGGVVDEVLMRLVDIFLSVPQILLVIVVVATVTLSYPRVFGLPPLDSRILLLIFAFAVTWWPFYARIVRGQVLVVREQKYVEAARASGAGRGRIILRHVIPNSVFPVLVQMSLDVGTIPLFIGTLVFLGFGIFPTPYFPEWGALSALSVGSGANTVQSLLTNCQLAAEGLGACVIPWWQLLFPGLTLFFYALSVNFLSDGLRDALDPRLRR
jgi:peptide/nickel transport system permease protein